MSAGVFLSWWRIGRSVRSFSFSRSPLLFCFLRPRLLPLPVGAARLPVLYAHRQNPAAIEWLLGEQLRNPGAHPSVSTPCLACNTPPHSQAWRESPCATPPPPRQNLLVARGSPRACSAHRPDRDQVRWPCGTLQSPPEACPLISAPLQG